MDTTGEHIFIVDATEISVPTLEEWPHVIEMALALIVAAGEEIILDEFDEPTEKRQTVQVGVEDE